MTSFTHLKSAVRLKELSRNLFDLTTGNFNPKRIEQMIAYALDFKLFYSTERVTDEVMHALFDLAEETQAIKKMHAMQAGEVMNRIEGVESENRAVLHTAMRDFFDHKNTAPAAVKAASLAMDELKKLQAFLKKIDGKFTDLIQIGIGGSELGPKAIYLALEAFQKKGIRVHFLSNVDPDDAASILEAVDLKKTLVVSVSKSGSTLETKTNEEFIREAFKKKNLSPKDHIVAATGKGSPMDDPENYLASFYIWDYIGGRYSVTSMIGAVTLGFALGYDHLWDFLRGASAMDKVALLPDPTKNLPLLSALLGIWNRNFCYLPTVAIIPYSRALFRLPAHLQQCDMESNGKRIDKQGHFVDFSTGPIIWGEPGTNGQHSFFQLLHQGTDTTPIEFIGFKESQYDHDLLYQGTTSQEKLLSNLFAQMIALAQGKKSDNPNKFFPGNRPSRLLFTEKCDPYHVGALLAYFEHKVAFQGFMWNINSFDQEGVQLGKVLATQMIQLFAKRRKKEGLTSQDFPLGQAFLRHL